MQNLNIEFTDQKITSVLSEMKKKYGKEPFTKVGDDILVSLDFVKFVTRSHLEAELIMNRKIQSIINAPNSEGAKIGVLL